MKRYAPLRDWYSDEEDDEFVPSWDREEPPLPKDDGRYWRD